MAAKLLQIFNKDLFLLGRNSLTKIFSLVLLLFIYSCTTIKIPQFFTNQKGTIISKGGQKKAEDYKDQLANLEGSFLKNPEIRVIKLDAFNSNYLDGLIKNLLKKNEIFFKDLDSAKVIVLDFKQPLHFSLPKGIVFLSKGLISKYIKHESVLMAVLGYELIKSERLLYPKQTFIPIGYTDLEEMIYLNRLSLVESLEVHKWAYHLLRRAGLDEDYYLYWLQTQNRNTADFVMQIGDVNQINREEAMFKAFLIRDSQKEIFNSKLEVNSSKSFYKFINNFREITQ